MKATRANVEKYAADKGYIPVQIDSIPEGFSFREPDLQVGDVTYKGRYVAFLPNEEWHVISVERPEDLLKEYKIETI